MNSSAPIRGSFPMARPAGLELADRSLPKRGVFFPAARKSQTRPSIARWAPPRMCTGYSERLWKGWACRPRPPQSDAEPSEPAANRSTVALRIQLGVRNLTLVVRKMSLDSEKENSQLRNL
jgi:hypothetical protein